MSVEQVYRVIVTRQDGAWLADVPELEGAHTYARTLPALDRAVREVVVMAVDPAAPALGSVSTWQSMSSPTRSSVSRWANLPEIVYGWTDTREWKTVL